MGRFAEVGSERRLPLGLIVCTIPGVPFFVMATYFLAAARSDVGMQRTVLVLAVLYGGFITYVVTGRRRDRGIDARRLMRRIGVGLVCFGSLPLTVAGLIVTATQLVSELLLLSAIALVVGLLLIARTSRRPA
jgi:hypothetical protein